MQMTFVGHHKPFGEHVEHMKPLKEVYEVPSPEEFYREYFRKSVPLVIRGVAKVTTIHLCTVYSLCNCIYCTVHVFILLYAMGNTIG